MEIRLLANRTGYLQDVEEVKHEWLNDLLTALGVDMGELASLEQPEQVELLIEQYKIEIITYPGVSALRIDLEEETVGEWAGPDFILKTEEETGEKYYEIVIEAWTFIEEEIDME